MNLEQINSPKVVPAHVRILVADDHEVMRLGIRNLLEAIPNWNICAEAGNGQEAIEKAGQYQPDIIIMDITMPVMNGLEASKIIAQVQPDLPIVLFSLHLSDEMISNFDRESIRGAVCKGDAARDLVDAINQILGGGTFFPQKRPVS